MPSIAEPDLYKAECIVFALVLGGVVLALLVHGLRQRRPELELEYPIAVAFGVRVLALGAVPLLGSASSLRGGDEAGFFFRAGELSERGIASDPSLDALTSELHIWILSLQLRIIPDYAETAVRIGHVLIAVAGLVLLAAAVYELAGARAARLAAWVLAFEPASIFFSGVLHKESPMILAAGLVAFGGAKLWTRRELSGLPLMLVGCSIAVATRPYAGWFLVAAAVAVTLHASVTRRGEQQGRALALATVVALLVGASLPTALEETSDERLQSVLQRSQDANARGDANLALERVDFSTREKVLTNLPIRIRDMLLRPYPWQTANASQRLGVMGVAVMLAVLALLLQQVLSSPRTVLSRAGPLVYPALFLLIAYSLSSGNAGTAFLYRTHLVVFGICIVVILREQRQQARAPAPASRSEAAPWLRDAAQPIG